MIRENEETISYSVFGRCGLRQSLQKNYNLPRILFLHISVQHTPFNQKKLNESKPTTQKGVLALKK